MSANMLESPMIPRHQRKISSTTEFKELTKKDSIYQLSSELDKLALTARGPQEKIDFEIEANGYKDLFSKFINGNGPIQWDKIEPLPQNSIVDYNSLNQPNKEQIREMLNKLVVVKLNGGLGKLLSGFQKN